MGRRRKNPVYSPPPLTSSPHHSSDQALELSPTAVAANVTDFSPPFRCLSSVHSVLPSPTVEDLASTEHLPYISLDLSNKPSPPPSPSLPPLPPSPTRSHELHLSNFNPAQTINVLSWVSQQSSPPTPATFPHSAPGYVSRMPTPIGNILVHHSDYYLEDGVVFLVETTLFKVPRYMLNQESEDFRQFYSNQFDPVGKGSTDADPIRLNDVGVRDFEQLLMLLYPRSLVGTAGIEHWTETEWQSVLHLATTWEMPQVRDFAVKKLTACASSITKILLGRRYCIPTWIRAGFLDLCLRESPMTDEEGSHLDWKEILKISRARETIRSKVLSVNRQQEWEYTGYGRCRVYKTSYDPVKYMQNRMVHQILDEIFGLEDLSSNTHSSDIDSIGTRPPSRAAGDWFINS